MNWVVWLFIIIALTIIEISTVNLVTVWFIVSAIVAMIVSLFNNNILISFGIFVVLGVLLLVLTRKTIVKLLGNNNVKTNTDRIIGMTGIVTEEIKKNKIGEIKVDGKLWSAISETDILVDELVTVEAIDSVKLIVKKVEGEI